jgi:glucose/arabinose dehydrogenase
MFAVLTHIAGAQVYPADFAQALVANGINNPTVMAFAPDGRIFVARQNGVLRVIKDNALLPTPFVSLTVNSTGERGLIGIVLDPDFENNNFIYLYYTVPGSPAHNRISRFTANGDVAQAGSELVVLELDPLSGATNHNGGAMHFGLDGKLYVAVGENANSSHAQNLDTYHGKLLRINSNGSVPDGNPFTTGSEQRKRVWSYGLRNPYTFSVHPETGRILVNDVGQGSWEEINDASASGQNFGWPATEGFFNATNYPNFTNPIFAYPHGSGDGKGCAITGGTFFYPTETNYPPQYAGKYFFQDLCNDWINTLDLSGNSAVRSPFATAISGNGLSLTPGNDGNIYYLSRAAGALYKIVYSATTIPYVFSQPLNLTVAEGQQATFSVTALGSTPLIYQWQKNMVDIPGANASSFTISDTQFDDAGLYQVIVTNAFGEVVSIEATLTVVMNQLPVAEITLPEPGTTYVAGTEVNFSGSGSDAEDGVLPGGSLSWQINFHHDTHKHDQPPIDGVSSGTFLIPNEGETSDNVWYRVILTATDANGFIGKDSVDVDPRKTTLDFNTSPGGLVITLDGQPLETPASVVSVEGMLRTIGAVTPQKKDGVIHTFESWSIGGDGTQIFTTPMDDIKLTAQFSSVVGVENVNPDQQSFLFPNPASQEYVSIYIKSQTPMDVNIRLVDLLSRTINSTPGNLNAGDNTIPLYIGNVQDGVYMVVVEGKDISATHRLSISR